MLDRLELETTTYSHKTNGNSNTVKKPTIEPGHTDEQINKKTRQQWKLIMIVSA